MMRLRSRRARARRAVTTLEFAILATVLIPATSATIELGLLLWTQTAMQSVASLVARCDALGGPQCSGGVAAYAVTLAGNWVLSGVITTANVTVGTSTTCNGATGSFDTVTITVPVWSRMTLKPFLPDTINVSSCFPN